MYIDHKHYQLIRPSIDEIIDTCDDMEADDTLIVRAYGKNADLILDICKDENYEGGDAYNMVDIATYTYDGKVVDDSFGVYVTDGNLYRELERIAEYRDFWVA